MHFVYRIIIRLKDKLTLQELTECFKLLYNSIKSDACELNDGMKNVFFEIYEKYKDDSKLLLENFHPNYLISHQKKFTENCIQIENYFNYSNMINNTTPNIVLNEFEDSD